LDVSQNAVLQELDCFENQLTSLDVTQNTALIVLGCDYNQLTSLDVSQNTALQVLVCNENQLTSLNVANGNNANIEEFQAQGNPYLTCIQVDDEEYSTTYWNGSGFNFDTQHFFSEDCGYCTQFTLIPDANFEQALIDLGIDTNPVRDGKVCTANIENVTDLYVRNKNISDLTGIEDFTALQNLNCYGNQLPSLDVSQNTALEYLLCGGNLLTTLDVSQNTVLFDLRCHNNQLTSLDVSQNTLLTYIDCTDNQLSSLDVIQNTVLTEMRFSDNQLTSLDVSQNTALQTLYCGGNQLTSLDVSQNTALQTLDCGANQLTSLDISQNIALKRLYCDNNQLTSLDVSQNTVLTVLFCGYNQLTSLDVSQNVDLIRLFAPSNELTSLDLSKNTGLVYLNCYNNQLSSLNVRNGNNTAISNINFRATDNANLFCIQVDDAVWSAANWNYRDAQSTFSEYCSNCENDTHVPDDNFEAALIEFGYDDEMDNYVCTENIDAITNLDINNREISDLTGIEDFTALEILDCHSNQLSSLDVSQNTALQTLYCEDNQLTSLDVSQNTVLEILYCHNDQLTSLDVSQNTALKVLNCHNNQLTSLDVSQNTALQTLWCYNNQLTSLDISQNTALQTLSCEDNQLTSLDVSQNTALQTLSCEDNQLTSLDVSQNTSLENLYCYNNQLTSLNLANGNNTIITNIEVNNNPSLTCIQVDDADYSETNWTGSGYVFDAQHTFNEDCAYSTVYIQDDNFEAALIALGYDTTPDDYVLQANIENITELDLSGAGIEDLSGIENFTALEVLDLSGNQISTVDLSANTMLHTIDLSGNGLTQLTLDDTQVGSKAQSMKIDVDKVSIKNSLRNLYLHDNDLETIDISKFPALETLNCANNTLVSLNLKNGNNTNITNFNATENGYLNCIEVDDPNYSAIHWTAIDLGCSFSNSCSTLGLEEQSLSEVVLYPNPATNQVFININEKAAYSIFNNLGQEVKKGSLQRATNTLDIRTLASGMYFVRIAGKTGTITKKLQVN
jgi:Leucine-rich repeat (LRR) protein